MIIKTIGLVFFFQNFINFLSFCESFIPTRIRYGSRSNVGAFPLRICPSGFLRFMIETVPHHYHGIVKSDEQVVTSKYDFQSKIWDPGAFNSKIEDNGIIWADLISNNRALFSSALKAVILSLKVSKQSDDAFSFLWSKISDIPIDLLGSGNLLFGCKIRELTFPDDDNDDHFPWSEISSSLEIVQCFLQSQEDFAHPVHHSFKQRHKLVGSNDGFFLLVRANQRHVMRLCFIPRCFHIAYSNKLYRLLVCYQVFTTLEILESISWWHWKLVLWQKQWIGRQWRLSQEHRNYLPESSSILFSRRRQNSESSPTTLDLFFLVKVMPLAFWSFSSKLIAIPKYVKGGLNRLHLLPVRLPNSRVTSTLSSKLYQFPVFAYIGRIGMFLFFVNTF